METADVSRCEDNTSTRWSQTTAYRSLSGPWVLGQTHIFHCLRPPRNFTRMSRPVWRVKMRVVC